jgi:hypothetical protein
MVIFVLVVIWVIALAPMALRRWRERSVTSSVSRFHRQIGGLRRAYPRLVAASLAGVGHGADEGSGSRERPLWATDAAPADHDEPRPRGRAPRPRAGLAARRRLILSRLVTASASAFALGAIPALRPLWVLAVVALVLTVGYVALLAYFNGATANRRERALVLPAPTAPAPTPRPWSRPAVAVVAVHRPLRRDDDVPVDEQDAPARLAARG